ncbi:MAG TPA: UbiA family prenyltransferase [bacterium]|nr:UbiA family prenyltransferase [bacterium]
MVMTVLRALRVHQWSKNGLLLVPLLASHRIWPLDWLPAGLMAIAAFSLCASGTYVINDLLDVAADRAHPTKRLRPIASGALAPGTAAVLATVVLATGVALAWPLGWDFLLTLGVYLTLTLAYSLWLKRVALLDVIVLATLYTLRVIAGHVVFGIVYSQWLLAFTVFLFLGLALVKRYGELLLGDRPEFRAAGHRRGYNARDVQLVGTLGICSSFVAVLVFALYINSDQVRELYRHPDLLWLAIPVLLYWVARVWRIAHQGEMDADPVIFALRDPLSYGVGLLLLAVVALAAGVLG